MNNNRRYDNYRVTNDFRFIRVLLYEYRRNGFIDANFYAAAFYLFGKRAPITKKTKNRLLSRT